MTVTNRQMIDMITPMYDTALRKCSTGVSAFRLPKLGDTSCSKAYTCVQ